MTKLAFTWAELLLIALLSTIGAGVCSLSARVVEQEMAHRAPAAPSFQDSVLHAEQALLAAREERAALGAQLREARLRQLRDSVMLNALPSEARSPQPATPDSVARERARLARSLRTDSALAVRLGALSTEAADAVIRGERNVAEARRSAARQLQARQRDFARERAAWTVAGALLGMALVLGVTYLALRAGTAASPAPHAGRVTGTTLAVVALILAHQVAGAPLTLLLGAVVALVVLVHTVKHAS